MHWYAAVFGVLTLLIFPPLARAAEPVVAGTQSTDTTPQTRALAEELITVGGESERMQKPLATMDNMLSSMIVRQLPLSNAETAAKVKATIDEALAPVASQTDEALVQAYEANFSDQQLSGALSFIKSPAGQAEASSLPLLKAELGAVLDGSPDSMGRVIAAEKAFADAPQSKRDLIRRIFAAQDFENHTHQGFTKFGTLLGQSFAAQPKGQIPSRSDEQNKADDDQFARATDEKVRASLAIEERYYVDHFSDAQLEATASYLESDAGRAMLQRAPIVRRAVGKAMFDQIATILSSMTEPVCAAAACTPEQHKNLSDFVLSMKEQSALIVGSF